MSARLWSTAIWLLGGGLGFVVGLSWLSGAAVDGVYLPMGPDAFLHASRILETYADIGSFYQLDTRGFAPEGAFFHWPWPFDLGLALLLHPLTAVTGLAPEAVLVWLPPCWAFVTSGLLVLTCRQLGMRHSYTAIAMLAFFVNPMTQFVHAAGRIDHNFAELSFVLASLWLALRLFEAPESRRRAAALGTCLGLAIGASITLFLLQLPVLLVATWAWARGRALPLRASITLGATLVLVTLAIAAFSLPTQQGYFEFAYLSWFQVYIALTTAVALAAMSRVPCSLRGLALLATAGTVLLLPIAARLRSGAGYLSPESSEFLSRLYETQSLLEIGWTSLTWGSGLVLFVPLIAIGALWQLSRTLRPGAAVLAIFTVFGLALLTLQYRFNFFGIFALCIPPLYWLDRWQRARGEHAVALPALAAVLAAVLQTPSFQFLWLERQPGLNEDYVRTRPTIEYLAELCERDPGIVLAPLAVGSYVRYHTRCPVYGTSMYGGGAEQTRAGDRALHLLGASPEEARAFDPAFRYVIVDRVLGFRSQLPDWARERNETGLNGILLTTEDAFPPGYQLLLSVDVEQEGKWIAASSRLFRVRRDQP